MIGAFKALQAWGNDRSTYVMRYGMLLGSLINLSSLAASYFVAQVGLGSTCDVVVSISRGDHPRYLIKSRMEATLDVLAVDHLDSVSNGAGVQTMLLIPSTVQ